MKTNKLFTIILCFVLLGNASIGQQASEEMLVAFKHKSTKVASKYHQQLNTLKQKYWNDSTMILTIYSYDGGCGKYSGLPWIQMEEVSKVLFNGKTLDSASESGKFVFRFIGVFKLDTVKLGWLKKETTQFSGPLPPPVYRRTNVE